MYLQSEVFHVLPKMYRSLNDAKENLIVCVLSQYYEFLHFVSSSELCERSFKISEVPI